MVKGDKLETYLVKMTTSVQIGYSLCKLNLYITKRVRARLVRRLIWVENLLCSNHNNPIYLQNKI